MKISIITVAYNSEKTIQDTLSSVAEQTHPDIEYIVVDGGSTDSTLSLVNQQVGLAKIVVSEPDTGIYNAMNKGLALASGDLIGFLNADDVFESSDSVAAISEAASSSPGALAVYGDLVYSSANDLRRVLRHWRSGPFTPSSLRYGWMPPHPTFYVRAKLLLQIGNFNEQLRIAADYDFMLRALTLPSASAVYVPKVLVRMRAGGASNRSFSALIRKSREDLSVMRHRQVGGWLCLVCKNLRKLPQFLRFN